jgi:putative FmdB family regulatory protein
MPIYEYRCPDCGEKFDKLVRLGSDAAVRCPRCGGESPQRQISLFAHTGGGGDSPSYASASCTTST